LNWIFNW